MKKIVMAITLLILTNSLCFAESSITPAVQSVSQTNALSKRIMHPAPTIVDPQTGTRYKAPFLQGLFSSIDDKQLVIMELSNKNPVTFVLKDSVPVYNVDGQQISLQQLKNGEKLKVHYQKDGMVALMVQSVY